MNIKSKGIRQNNFYFGNLPLNPHNGGRRFLFLPIVFKGRIFENTRFCRRSDRLEWHQMRGEAGVPLITANAREKIVYLSGVAFVTNGNPMTFILELVLNEV